MPKISIRLPDAEYNQLLTMRGNMTTSDYVRRLIATERQETKKELSDFGRLFQDVSAIRQTLVTLTGSVPDQSALLTLAEYLKEVMSIANPPAYANHADRLKDLFEKLKSTLKG